MLKNVLSIIWIILLFNISFWISQDKLNYLKSLNISIDNNILSKQQVSRYEAARYLNYAQCFDCLNPSQNIKNKFNYWWFSNFKKEPNFYLNDISPQDKYYYCVASLASLNYVHGYPKTNPICGWDFCGSNNLSYWELLQIVVNIISNKILNKYTIDNVDNFYSNMMSIKGTNKAKSMDITENSYKIVNQIKNSWLKTYQIQNFDEFYLYEKYCNLFPKSCGYKEFGNIKKWNYMLSIINILYRENLLTYKEAINIHPHKLVSWEELIQWLYKVKKINACKINNNLINTKKKETKDLIWIEIVCNPLVWNTPLETKCKAKTEWPVKKIVWTYNGQIIWEWQSLSHTFKKIWNKKITATAIWKNNDTAIANSFLEVWKENNNWYSIWLQISPSPSSWLEWTKIVFSTQIKWSPDYIIRSFGDGSTQTTKPWVNPSKIYPKAWNYTVVAKAIKNWKVVATSSSIVKIYKKWNKSKLPSSYLHSNPLIWYTNQDINFSLHTTHISVSQINKVVWNFGDGSTQTTSTLSTSHHFSSSWAYPVSATIYLKNWTSIPNYITQKIISTKKKEGAVMTANPLQQNIWKTVHFKITPKWFSKEDIKNIIWLYWDGNSSKTNNLNSNHKYYESDKYNVNAIIKLYNWNTIYTSLTEVILWTSIWLQISPSPSSWPEWTKVVFSTQIKWSPDYIIRSFGDGSTQTTKPWVNPSKIYPKAWNYTVVAKAIKNWKVVATSSSIVKIYKKWNKSKLPSSYLHSNPLIWYTNQDINFSLHTTHISVSQINKVVWNFGDGSTQTTSTLSTSHHFSSSWAYPVSATIYLKNWTSIPNYITQKIISDANVINIPNTNQNNNPIDNWNNNSIGGWIPTNISNNFTFTVENCNTCPCHFAEYKTAFLPWMKIQAILVNPSNPSQIYTVSKMTVVR